MQWVGARLRRVRRRTAFIESDNLAHLIVPCVANGRDAVAPLPSGPLWPTGQPFNLSTLYCISLEASEPLVNSDFSLSALWPTGQLVHLSTGQLVLPLPTGQLVNRPASLPLLTSEHLIN